MGEIEAKIRAKINEDQNALVDPIAGAEDDEALED